MAGRRRLPFIAVEATDIEDDLRDFLLGRARASAIEGLQHSSGACFLLLRESCIRGHNTAVEAGEETVDRFQPVEAIEPERHESGTGGDVETTIQGEELKAVPIGEREEQIAVVARAIAGGPAVVGLARSIGVRPT